MEEIGADELLAAVTTRFDRHPWARLCRSPRIRWERAWDAGDAVVWRSGHPWTARPEWHVLGDPLAAHEGLLEAAGGEPVTDLVSPAAYAGGGAWGLGGPGLWSIRMKYAPGTVLPGEDVVDWLTEADDVDAFLDLAMPHAAIRPGDARGGRWFGVRDDDGALLAAAVETVLSPVPHLSSLAVHPSARRRGLGAAVTSWFVRASFAVGAPEVMLAVDDDNAAGHAAYDALGFDRWDMHGWGPR